MHDPTSPRILSGSYYDMVPLTPRRFLDEDINSTAAVTDDRSQFLGLILESAREI